MSKKQKVWLWIFGAMFLVPEILFFTTPMFIRALNGESFYRLSSPVLHYEIFFSHPFYLLSIVLIEICGAFGLLIMCIGKNKKILVLSLGIIVLWLLFIFIITCVTSWAQIGW